MNIQRILLSALLGATLVVTAACGTDAAQQAKSEVGKEVKVETKMPSFDATPIADEYATIHTNKGDIKVRLYGSKAPITVKNFKSLIEQGYYNNLTFHRVIDGFMIQGGDPVGNGTGGSKENIVGEFASNGFNNPIKHTRGVISMARSMDPNSASSQFFIMHADAPHLDGNYAAFGHVVEGLEVVDEIANTPTDFRDKPTTPVIIKRAYIA